MDDIAFPTKIELTAEGFADLERLPTQATEEELAVFAGVALIPWT